MLKIRITYANEEEKDLAIQVIKKNFNILNISRVYIGRGNSKYNNVYLDLENK